MTKQDSLDFLEFGFIFTRIFPLQNPGAEKWRPMAISNPSTRLRMARSMPHWVLVRMKTLSLSFSSPTAPTTTLRIPYTFLAVKRRNSKRKRSRSNNADHRPRRKPRHRRSPETVVTQTTRSSNFRPDRKHTSPRHRASRTSVHCAAPRTCSPVATFAMGITARPATTWTTSTRKERITCGGGSWPTWRRKRGRHFRRRETICRARRRSRRQGETARTLR